MRLSSLVGWEKSLQKLVCMIIFKLHPNYERWLGHCQITYTTKNENGQRLVYCLQDQGEKFGGIRLMRCSQDNEPSHEVRLKGPASFEMPTGDSKLEEKVKQWIKNQTEEVKS